MNVKSKETVFDISETVSLNSKVTLTIKFAMDGSFLKFVNVTKI